MSQFFSQLVTGPNAGNFANETNFWHDAELAAFCLCPADAEQTLRDLVFKVRRNPNNLLAHLRRIYFCFQQSLSFQLYAALLDFLIVLQGKGQALSHRMINSCRSHLDPQQVLELAMAVKNPQTLSGNRFSLFTNGLLGKCELIAYQHDTEEKLDVLALANDFIEYSQLDEAMDTLEIGIAQHPERQDLQEALLELYISTDSSQRFQKFYTAYSTADMQLIDKWRLTAASFAGRQS
jgi:hypothetical protein